MRDWCVVLDATSGGAAGAIGKALTSEVADVDVDTRAARVWCFADTERAVSVARDRIRQVLERESLWEGTLQVEPALRVWNDERHRYVDPERPDEDPDTHASSGSTASSIPATFVGVFGSSWRASSSSAASVGNSRASDGR